MYFMKRSPPMQCRVLAGNRREPGGGGKPAQIYRTVTGMERRMAEMERIFLLQL